MKISSQKIDIQEILHSPWQLEHFLVLAEPTNNLAVRLIVGLLQCGQLYIEIPFLITGAFIISISD